MKITFLTEEWTQSTKGGRSTLIRQLAIELAKLENVETSILIPNASLEDKKDAEKYDIKVFEPEENPGYEPVDCLQFPPDGFSTDVIIGHGIKPGCHGQALKNHLDCQWVHVVLRNAEETAMFQNIPGAISKGQKQHETEVKLCKRADMVMTIGSKLNESFNSALQQCKKDHVCSIIPGIFDEFSREQKRYRNSKTFEILVFGRGNTEDFELKGLHVAAKAVAHLNKHDSTYILKVVGAPEGEQEKLAEKLEGLGISRNHLIVRSFYKERGKLAELFLEVDLVLMPSGTEGFGLAALEALSAGVPILITNNSGMAEALKKVPLGCSCIVNSEADWTEEIKKVRENLEVRLEEARMLRDGYKKKYCWRNQCADFVEKLRTLHSG